MSKPSDTELILLKPLWESERLSAREIHDATVGLTEWSFSSTRRTLDRMVDKGLVRVEPLHGVKTFVPAQSKLKTMAGLISDFTKNVLGTDRPLPAAAFADSEVISEDEINDLELLLEDLDTEESQ